MAKFIVEQYERHSAKYEVEAENAAEAISIIQDGGGDLIETEYIEIDENSGMNTDNLSYEEAKILDMEHMDFVPGIRSVKEV